MGVLATKEIVFRCYRTNEEHVTFQLLIMAELSTCFESFCDRSVDIHLRFGELFLLDHCVLYGFLAVSGMCGVISQRRRNVFAVIVGVLATKEIVFRCYRSIEEHVTFQLLIMAEPSTFF